MASAAANVTRGARRRQQDRGSGGFGLEAVVRALDGKAPKKVIVVPDRIVNIVA